MSRDILELAGSLAYLDDLHAQFSEQPGEVDPSWHELLDGHAAGSNGNGAPQPAPQEAQREQPQQVPTNGGSARPGMPVFTRPGPVTMSPIVTQVVPSVWPLVNAFRTRGHFATNLDPLGLLDSAPILELDPKTWGYGERDLERVI